MKLKIQKTKIISPGLITLWKIQREKVETWQISPTWAPRSLQMVTAGTKLRHLLLGRKAMTNPDSVLKSRDITLPTKVLIVKSMVFPIVMYRRESWTIKKA